MFVHVCVCVEARGQYHLPCLAPRLPPVAGSVGFGMSCPLYHPTNNPEVCSVSPEEMLGLEKGLMHSGCHYKAPLSGQLLGG